MTPKPGQEHNKRQQLQRQQRQKQKAHVEKTHPESYFMGPLPWKQIPWKQSLHTKAPKATKTAEKTATQHGPKDDWSVPLNRHGMRRPRFPSALPKRRRDHESSLERDDADDRNDDGDEDNTKMTAMATSSDHGRRER